MANCGGTSLKFVNLRIPIGLNNQRSPYKIQSYSYPWESIDSTVSRDINVDSINVIRRYHEYNMNLFIDSNLVIDKILITQVYFTKEFTIPALVKIKIVDEISGEVTYENDINAVSSGNISIIKSKLTQVFFPPTIVEYRDFDKYVSSITLNVVKQTQVYFPITYNKGSPESIKSSLSVSNITLTKVV